MLHKKARLWSDYLIIIILAVVSLLFLFPMTLQSTELAEKIINDDTCERSLALRCNTKTDIIVTEIATPILCMTKETIEFPLKGDTSQDFLRDLSITIVDIWRIFQRGQCDETFLFRGYFGSDDKTKCFLYQPFIIKKLKDKDNVKWQELINYMNNNLYRVDEEDDNCQNDGGYCAENEINWREELKSKHKENLIYFKCADADKECTKKTESKKKICCYSRYECLNKGGICESSNFENREYKRYDAWGCPLKKVCYVKTQNYITYMDYIKGSGEDIEGYLQRQDELDFTPLAKGYVIAFATRMDVDWRSSFDRMLKRGEPPRIVIARTGELDSMCIVQRDVKGR